MMTSVRNSSLSVPVLTTHNLSIGFKQGAGKKAVGQHLNLSLHAGELVCLLGTNGVGKTTLLRTLGQLQPELSGEVFLHGKSVKKMSAEERARSLGLVLTERLRVGHTSVYSLVALGRYPHTGFFGNLRDEDSRVVYNSLKSVGAEMLAYRAVDAISDGELQKVMVARALAQEPEVLILDEPTNFLDISNRIEMLMLLHSLAHEQNKAVLMSTHDFELAMKMADKIWLFSQEEGMRCGVPEELVLKGEMQTLFAGHETEFDVQTGTLKIHKRHLGKVSVTGDSLAVFWTTRALERVGYDVFPGHQEASVEVEVVSKDKKWFWDVALQSHKRICSSLEDLIQVLGQQGGGSPL